MANRLTLGRAAGAFALAATTLVMAALPAVAAPVTGKVQETKTEGHAVFLKGRQGSYQASLMHLKLDGAEGKTLKVYCVEIEVGVSHTQTMVEVPWNSYPNNTTKFKQNSAKINWALQKGYPATALDALKTATGAADLEESEAITATQAALWHYSDGTELDREKVSDRPDANADILALYDYLTGEKNVGIADQPKLALDITPKTATGPVGSLIGPYKISTNGEITDIFGELPDDVTITDKDGKAVEAANLKNGSEVYLKVPAGIEPGKAEFAVAALAKINVGRLFVGDKYLEHPDNPGKYGAQSLIVAESETSKLEAKAEGTWTTAPVTTTPPTTTAAPTTTPVPQGKNEELPNTGASILWPLLLGLGLVGGGAGALIYQRKRKAQA